MKKIIKRKNNKGFTLIELIIATFIFTVVTIIGYSGLNSFIKIKEFTKPHQKNIINFSNSVSILTRDFINFANKPFIDSYLAKKQALIVSNDNNNSNILELSIFNNDFVGLKNNNGLSRVFYFIKNKNLYRGFFYFLSNDINKKIAVVKILENVEEIKIIVTDNKKINFENKFTSSNNSLPLIIKLIIKSNLIGELTLNLPILL